MKKILPLTLFLFLCVHSAFTQCVTNVNFNTWVQGGHPGNGSWAPQLGGSQVYQSINGNPTFFLSPNDLMNVHITGNFRSIDSDNDWMGFVFSYQNPMGASDSFDLWLFDWKQEPQNGASDGKSLCRVNGVIPPGNYTTTFWNHQNTPEFTVVQNTFGSGGWNQGTNHSFELFLTYTRATIYVDGVLTFDRQDCFKPGRFGFYNYSQSDCIYSNFQYDLFVDFNVNSQICLGDTTAISFVNPCANGTLNTYQSATWNFGDGTTIVNNNPTFSNINVQHVYTQPGIYTITLTMQDVSGCTATKSRTVEVRGPLTLTPTLTPPPCNGGSNGGLSVAASNGFGNYTYGWNGGAVTGPNYIGASAGNYVVSATDGVCYATAQYTLNQPPPLTATTSHTDAPCNGNGTATIAISGGTPPYSNVTWAGTAGYTVSLPPGTWIANFQDANGCSALLQYTETITALPCGITSSVSKTNVSCFGGSNGSITLTVNSTTPPVNINWSNGGSGPTISNLAAGTYSYTVTDALPAHTFSGSVTITQPGAAMVAGVSTIGIACAGSNTGEAIASVTAGGNSPYTYAWSNGGGNTPHLTNLPPGNITATVTDNIGCTATASGTISGVPSLNLTVAVTPDSCYHSSKGKAIANVTGGVSPYSYYWSNFLANDTNANLIAGTYTVTVTDGNGCTVSGSGTVNGPPVLTTSYTLQHVNCNGASTGSFSTTSSGGTAPLTYTWNPSTLSGANQNNLPAGIYAYTVSDANGCFVQRQDTIRQPATALTATSSHTDVTCYGANNGTVTVNVSGGTPPYTFLGNPVPAGSTTISNLTPNTYAGSVIDSNGCNVPLTETIVQPGIQSLTVDSTDNPCAGALQGSVSANFVNATGNVTYNWNPGGVQPATISNLASGIYNVTATDANNCSLTGTTIINEPPAPVMTVTASDALCFGANGSATANPTGGNGPFSYTWSNNAGGNTATVSPPAGNYNVSATDANGCNQTASFTINEPTQLVSSETHTDNLCFGTATGTATITLSGGTGAYTYQWSPNVSNTNTATGLQAGSYSVTGTDVNNCTVLQAVVIAEPTQVDVTASSNDVLCFGGSTGSFTAIATGGTGTFSYVAVTNSGNSQQSANGQFTGQSADTYTIYATDNNQCIDSTTVIVNEPPQLVSSATAVDVTCYQYTDGQVNISVNGGSPAYTYSFSNGIQNSTGLITNLAPGSYDVTVTDANGCTSLQTATVSEPDSVSIVVSPAVTEVKLGESLPLLTSTNHSGSATYTWQPAFGLTCYDCANPVFNGIYNATYTVTAITDMGCTGTGSVTVTVIPNYDVFVPNAFTPNGDGNNDTWKFFGNLSGVKQMNVKVFNRIGEKVFESNDINFEWDGSYLGKPSPNGVYTYTAGFVWLNNHNDNQYKGTITIIR